MKVAYLHGLDAEPAPEKVKILSKYFDEVYAPKLDYRNDIDIFKNTLEYIKINKIDLIIGSSMGGWLGYCLSTNLGIKSILFNPAIHYQSIETNFKIGNLFNDQLVILGDNDDVVNPILTSKWLSLNSKNYNIIHENIGHRISIDIFEKYINYY